MALATPSSNNCRACFALVFCTSIIGTQSVDNARAANSMLQSSSALVMGQNTERMVSEHQTPRYRADADAQEIQYVNDARGTAEHFLPTGSSNLEITFASIASGNAKQFAGNSGKTVVDPITQQLANPNVQEITYVNEARGTAEHFLPTGSSNLEITSASIASGNAKQLAGNSGKTVVDPITQQSINPNDQELSYVNEARATAEHFLPTSPNGNLEFISASIGSGNANQANPVGNSGGSHDYSFNAASIASGMAGQVGGLATAADLAHGEKAFEKALS